MKKMTHGKRSLSAVLAMILAMLLLVSSSLSAIAAEPSYTPQELGVHPITVYNFDDGKALAEYSTKVDTGTDGLTTGVDNMAIEDGTLKVKSTGAGDALLFDAYSNIKTFSIDVKLGTIASNKSTAKIVYYANGNGVYSAFTFMMQSNGNIYLNPTYGTASAGSYNTGVYRFTAANSANVVDKWITIKLTYGTTYNEVTYSAYNPDTVTSKYITKIQVFDKATGTPLSDSGALSATATGVTINHNGGRNRAFAYGVDRGIEGNENAVEPEEIKVGFISDSSTFYADNIKGMNLLYLIKDEYLPSARGTQVTKLSFRVYFEKIENNCPPRLIYAYQNLDNYYSVVFTDMTKYEPDLIPLRYYAKINGEVDSKQLVSVSGATMGEWSDMEFTYTQTSCKVSVTHDGNTVSYAVNYVLGAQIAFGLLGSTRPGEMYIDDVNLSFATMDYDVNDVLTDININYQGNTFQNPNETVVLNGSSIGDNVSSAELFVIEEGALDYNNPQYIFENNYDSSQVDEGIVTQSTVPSLTQGTPIEFVQKTLNSLKFTLPESDEKHIYAVRLNPTYINEASEIIYLNNPELDFVMGDDADATRGGTLRIIGNNLFVDDAHTVSVVLKSTSTQETVKLTDLSVIEGDSYSIEAKIPTDMPLGEYEVYVHNGYGDNTCWSEPMLCTIKANPEKDNWNSRNIVSIKDYGAVGDALVNDTYAIISALNDVYKKGGGTVYFPRGQYRVISTIAIPRNVTIEGESLDNTAIFWDAHHWDYNEVPPLITFTGNVEIKNIYLYATRNSSVTRSQSDLPPETYNFLFGDPNNRNNDNVYIENVTFLGAFLAGYPSAGGMGFGKTGELTAAEVDAIVTHEAVASKISFGSGGRNLHASNVTVLLSKYPGYANGISVGGYDAYIQNCKTPQMGFGGRYRRAIIENNDFEGRTSGFVGGDVYVARNKFGHQYDNNREGWVADGIPRYLEEKVQLMENDSSKKTFKVVSRNSFFENQFAGMEIYVVSGQGLGQCRTVLSNTVDGIITLNEPFTISPNRNSIVTIFQPRMRNKFIQNSFVECSTNGPYGVCVDGIWDGNTFSYSQGQYFCPNHVHNWYISVLNQTYTEPVYIHGVGVGSGYGGSMTDNQIFIWTNTVKRANSFIGMTIKNNYLDGYNIHIKGGVVNAIKDVIIENNTILNVQKGIYYEGSDSNYFDGLYIRNNEIDASEYEFPDPILESSQNLYGYNRAIIVNDGEKIFTYGDVNFDGKVTLKDCTLVTYYYLDMTTFNEEQLKRADVNCDNSYDLKDATRIKQFILYGVALGELNSSADGGYYPGAW